MEFKDSRAVVDSCLERLIETCYLEDGVTRSEYLVQQLVTTDALLGKIHTKSAKRSLTDKKVAPGSDAVVCSVLNARYCLCLLNIHMGKYNELQSETYDLAIKCYQRALIWYPKSVEAGHLLGLCLRSRAVLSEELEFVQYLWERALVAYNSLDIARAATDIDYISTPLTSSEVSVLTTLLSAESSLSGGGNVMTPSAAHIASSLRKAQSSILYNEQKAGLALLDSLILFHCQENRYSEAFPLLLSKRYQWKLSQQVLTYSPSGESDAYNKDRLTDLEERDDFPFTFGYDSVLPEAYLRRMQHIFRPSAPFWSEHDYDFYSNCSRRVGYFSYLYPFRDRVANNVVEQVIDIVYKTVINQLEGEAQVEQKQGSRGSRSKTACLRALKNGATQAEWWVHSRPHTSGHQFHFDSDETALYGGDQAQHPIASCIIYLSEGVGGPTVVTNQTLASTSLASYGFLMHPQENRLAVFDATFLHGVIPGKGLCPAAVQQELADDAGGSGGVPSCPPRRRLSFMVGFWRKINAKDRGPGCPGPGQPFPETSSNSSSSDVLNHTYTWPDEVKDMLPSWQERRDWTNQSHVVHPQLVEPIWESVNSDDGFEQTNRVLDGVGIQAQYSTCFQGF